MCHVLQKMMQYQQVSEVSWKASLILFNNYQL